VYTNGEKGRISLRKVGVGGGGGGGGVHVTEKADIFANRERGVAFISAWRGGVVVLISGTITLWGGGKRKNSFTSGGLELRGVPVGRRETYSAT